MRAGVRPAARRSGAIGIAAHDFAQALGAREVVLTRALRVEGAPTVPSRWLLRLDTVLRAAGLEGALGAGGASRWRWQARSIEPAARIAAAAAGAAPAGRGAAAQAVGDADRDLAARSLRDLCAHDPAARAARAARRRPRRAPIAASSSTRRSTNSSRAFRGDLPADAEAAAARASARTTSARRCRRPGVWAFWWPRFERIARWFVARGARAPALSSATSAARCKGTLDARRARRAVRAHRARPTASTASRDGGLVLIDYKTGVGAAAEAMSSTASRRNCRSRRRSPRAAASLALPARPCGARILAAERRRSRRRDQRAGQGRRRTARADRRRACKVCRRSIARFDDPRRRPISPCRGRKGAALFRLRASRAASRNGREADEDE